MAIQKIFEIIREQMKGKQAPVDLYGCSKIGEINMKSKVTKNFNIFIALLLSSQTKDLVTYTAVKNINNRIDPTPENILGMNSDVLHDCISKVGFHNKKFEFLVECSKIMLHDKTILESTNQIEDLDNYKILYKKLLNLPGIGPKMATLYISNAYKVNIGVGVDTHVHRIYNRILNKTESPGKVKYALENDFCREEWNKINKVLVGFGQTICLPVKPQCDNCRANKFCAYYLNKW